jgi:hypothetical protein
VGEREPEREKEGKRSETGSDRRERSSKREKGRGGGLWEGGRGRERASKRANWSGCVLGFGQLAGISVLVLMNQCYYLDVVSR